MCYIKARKTIVLLYGQSAGGITAMAEKYSVDTGAIRNVERYKEGRAVNVAQNYQILDFFLFLSILIIEKP